MHLPKFSHSQGLRSTSLGRVWLPSTTPPLNLGLLCGSKVFLHVVANPRVSAQRVACHCKLRARSSQSLIHSPWPGQTGKSEDCGTPQGRRGCSSSSESRGSRSGPAGDISQWVDTSSEYGMVRAGRLWSKLPRFTSCLQMSCNCVSLGKVFNFFLPLFFFF